MKRYNSYKTSDVSWIKTIPKHWDSRKMKFCFNERSEKNHPNEVKLSATQSHGVIPQTLYEDKGNHVVDVNKNFDGLKLVKVGDFVVHLRSFQGGLAYAHYQGIISAAYTILSPKEAESALYYKYLFTSFPYIQLLKTCVTGIREGQNIDYAVLGNKYIPIPLLDEQEAIVAFLDSKISKIDAYIGEREKEIIALGEFKQAVIASVVTRGLNPDVPMRDSGIPWLGQIPAHWKELKLSQIAREHYISNKDVHHQNLLSLSYGKIIRKDINRTDGLLPASFDGYQIVEPGNIVLRLTDLQNDQKSLRVGLATEEGIVTGAYLSLEVRDNILPEYAYLFLHTSDIHKYFYTMGSGIRQGLNYSGIRDIKVPVPSIEEQQTIVDYINAKTANIDGLIANLSAQIERLNEYKQRLISDAVTGQIDVRDYKPVTSAQ